MSIYPVWGLRDETNLARVVFNPKRNLLAHKHLSQKKRNPKQKCRHRHAGTRTETNRRHKNVVFVSFIAVLCGVQDGEKAENVKERN